MSVIAPPESPPEVQRPYGQWSAPDAPRISTYRRWTRAQQAGLAAVVAVCVLAGALAGIEWGSTGPWAALQLVILVVVMGTVETLIERDGVRRALVCAEPLSDNAIEVTTGPLEALTERRRLLRGGVLGAGLTLMAVVLGAGAIVSAVVTVAGICGGRVASLEVLLRSVVERGEPHRVYFVWLGHRLPSEPPLLWRPAVER